MKTNKVGHAIQLTPYEKGNKRRKDSVFVDCKYPHAPFLSTQEGFGVLLKALHKRTAQGKCFWREFWGECHSCENKTEDRTSSLAQLKAFHIKRSRKRKVQLVVQCINGGISVLISAYRSTGDPRPHFYSSSVPRVLTMHYLSSMDLWSHPHPHLNTIAIKSGLKYILKGLKIKIKKIVVF